MASTPRSRDGSPRADARRQRRSPPRGGPMCDQHLQRRAAERQGGALGLASIVLLHVLCAARHKAWSTLDREGEPRRSSVVLHREKLSMPVSRGAPSASLRGQSRLRPREAVLFLVGRGAAANERADHVRVVRVPERVRRPHVRKDAHHALVGAAVQPDAPCSCGGHVAPDYRTVLAANKCSLRTRSNQTHTFSSPARDRTIEAREERRRLASFPRRGATGTTG